MRKANKGIVVRGEFDRSRQDGISNDWIRKCEALTKEKADREVNQAKSSRQDGISLDLPDLPEWRNFQSI